MLTIEPLSLTETSISQPLFQGSGITEKQSKTQRQLVTTRKQCFQTQWGRGVYDSKMVVTPCLRFMQVQVRQHPSVDGRGRQEVLSLTKQLLISSSY